MRTFLLGALLSLVLGTGCTAIRLSNLVGKDSSEVFASFGPPNQIIADGKGGSIWIYSKTSTTVNGGYQPGPVDTSGMSLGQKTAIGFAQGFSQGMNQPTVETNVSHRMVYLNSNGVVYNWSIANP